MENGKIMKVTIKYENVIYSVEGKEAEKWKQIVHSQAVLDFAHGGFSGASELKWKITRKRKEGK